MQVSALKFLSMLTINPPELAAPGRPPRAASRPRLARTRCRATPPGSARDLGRDESAEASSTLPAFLRMRPAGWGMGVAAAGGGCLPTRNNRAMCDRQHNPPRRPWRPTDVDGAQRSVAIEGDRP